MKKLILSLSLVLVSAQLLFSQSGHEQLMHTTYQIAGMGSDNKPRTGTVFFTGVPSQSDSTTYYHVMITAAHVLDSIITPTATLYFRDTANDDKLFPYVFQIRNGLEPIYTKHPEVDVAAMYMRIPIKTEVINIGISDFATNDFMTKFEIHPGDQLFCLGYPLGLSSNQYGYPILRSGFLASYPLTPMEEFKTFYFDFEVFPGNSGGPVYIADKNRIYGGTMHMGQLFGILGLVTSSIDLKEKISASFIEFQHIQPLMLANIINSSYILETISMLPPKVENK
ncbi:MAG: trypsin-like peptidase domain-containing protein [FCB group bacterium]|nr:trypsin-like peptidase domain-containing protein [FCB group bacterium]